MDPLARRWVVAWNAHDTDAIVGWYAGDGTHRMASGNTYVGAEAIRGMVVRTLEAYPDLAFSVRGAFRTADRFAIEYTMRGAQRGPAGDRPGTGRSVVVDGALVGTVDGDGRARTCVDYVDHLDVRRQLGLAADG